MAFILQLCISVFLLICDSWIEKVDAASDSFLQNNADNKKTLEQRIFLAQMTVEQISEAIKNDNIKEAEELYKTFPNFGDEAEIIHCQDLASCALAAYYSALLSPDAEQLLLDRMPAPEEEEFSAETEEILQAIVRRIKDYLQEGSPADAEYLYLSAIHGIMRKTRIIKAGVARQLLTAYAMRQDIRSMRRVFATMKDLGKELTIRREQGRAANILLKAYIKVENMPAATELYKWLNTLGAESALQPLRAHAANMLVQYFALRHDLKGSLEIFRELQELGNKSSIRKEQTEAAQALIKAYVAAGDANAAEHIYASTASFTEPAFTTLPAENALEVIHTTPEQFIAAEQILTSTSGLEDLPLIQDERGEAFLSLINIYALAGMYAESEQLLEKLYNKEMGIFPKSIKALAVHAITVKGVVGGLIQRGSIKLPTITTNLSELQQNKANATDTDYSSLRTAAELLQRMESVPIDHPENVTDLLQSLQLLGENPPLLLYRAKGYTELALRLAHAGSIKAAYNAVIGIQALGNSADILCECARAATLTLKECDYLAHKAIITKLFSLVLATGEEYPTRRWQAEATFYLLKKTMALQSYENTLILYNRMKEFGMERDILVWQALAASTLSAFYINTTLQNAPDYKTNLEKAYFFLEELKQMDSSLEAQREYAETILLLERIEQKERDPAENISSEPQEHN